MRFFTARRLALAAVFPALVVLSVIPGCSQQGEGERCGDDKLGNAASDDCDDGLVCTSSAVLLNGKDLTNRCCYPNRVTDSRCTPGTSAPSTAGAGGGAGAASTAGTAGADATGTGGADAAGAGGA